GVPRMSVIRALFALIAAAALPGIAWAAGDAARGEALAQTWCANCHLVEPNSSARDSAPPWREIARRGVPDHIGARPFHNPPHQPTPTFALARPQIDDIVAYLKSL